MRHPHHLPPNLTLIKRNSLIIPQPTPEGMTSTRPRPSADAMGILLPPQPLQRTCGELGICQGDGRCHGCDPVEPAAPAAEPLWHRWGYAILVTALTGLSAGIVLGALRWAADWVGA